jgi:hypothetical protein
LACLLKARAKVSGTDIRGWTPLHAAARFMPKDSTGKTPLDDAESSAMIKLLKQNGATER